MRKIAIVIFVCALFVLLASLVQAQPRADFGDDLITRLAPQLRALVNNVPVGTFYPVTPFQPTLIVTIDRASFTPQPRCARLLDNGSGCRVQ